jgi:hypothetical protein
MVQAGARGATFTPSVYARGPACSASAFALACQTANPAAINYTQPTGGSFIMVDGAPSGATLVPHYTFRMLPP